MKTTFVQINFPSQFARFINNTTDLEFEGESIADFINNIEVRFGNIRERLLDGDGQLKPYLNLFVGKKNIRSLQGIQTLIPEGERISLLLSRAGG